MKDPLRVELDDDGTLNLRGRDDWCEPLCAACNEPIRWCLDMTSFTTGAQHRLAHARCVWTPEAFRDQARLAGKQLQDAA